MSPAKKQETQASRWPLAAAPGRWGVRVWQEPGRQDFPLGKLSTEQRAEGVWVVRGLTNMAKKVNFKDTSGNLYKSLPLLNVRSVTLLIK